jgi:hypothetical protein
MVDPLPPPPFASLWELPSPFTALILSAPLSD